jgi:RNA polymerase sigma-70 factor, ECF subfamily
MIRPVEQSDDELVALARTGSASAMEALYRRYRDRIMTFAFRMTGDRSLAEDVFQNTFIYFYEHLEKYAAQGKLAAYLFRIARSLALDGLKAGKRDRRAMARMEPLEPSPEEPIPTDRAQKALQDLAPHLREIVTMRLFDCLDYGRIAEITGLSEATARSRMRYALEALRNTLKTNSQHERGTGPL